MTTVDLSETLDLLHLARRLRARRRGPVRAPSPAGPVISQREAVARIADAFHDAVPNIEHIVDEHGEGGLVVEFVDPETEAHLGAVELHGAGGAGRDAIAELRMPEGAPPDEVIAAALDGVTVAPAQRPAMRDTANRPRQPRGKPRHDQWVTGAAVDRSGTAEYTHLIRAADDPERGDIRKLPEALRDRSAEWRRALKKTSVEEWKWAIWHLLSDGQPRTFNRIGVELLDKTADLLLGLPPDFALWSLVAEEKVEHTLNAPILFRVRAGAVPPAPPPEATPSPAAPAGFGATLLSALPPRDANDPALIARYVRAHAQSSKDKSVVAVADRLAQQVERERPSAQRAAGWLDSAARNNRQMLFADIASALRLGVHAILTNP